MRCLLLVIIVIILSFSSLFAQWECPSKLGGFLKPLGDSRLMWGAELTGAGGYLTNNSIFNSMGLLGVDYSTSKQTLYFEGGFKYWNRIDNDLNIKYHQSHLGIRELFYQYRGNFGNFKLGLQTMNLEENYLLNERVLGFNYQLGLKNWTFNAVGGTVTKDFARNGTFCNVSYLYDIIPLRNRALLGNKIGDTNMAGITLSYHPSRKTDIDKEDVLNSGFSVKDEFKSSAFKIESIGMTLYEEFGNWINQPVLLGGLYSKIYLFSDIYFNPEVLFQSSQNNNALIYSLKLDKSVTWENSQRTDIVASYYGLKAIDNNAMALNSFSNIFSGSVLRLDVPDLPFYQFGVKHVFPVIKTHIKFLATGQFKANSMHEYDLELGKNFFNRLLINGNCGYVKSLELKNGAQLLRIEIRLDF